MISIGVIGLGYVGSAINNGLNRFYNVLTFDLKGGCTHESINSLSRDAKLIFICVPTPMNKDGSCNTETVESVVSEINQTNQENIVVIKSTVPPGTTQRLASKYTNIKLIFSPEFLTEANYLNDFIDCNRIIFGGDLESCAYVSRIFKAAYPDKRCIQTNPTTAEMVKYMANSFLATKVSFSNEIYDICSQINVDYDKVVECVTLDDRLGKSHWAVPGPDGKRGFGGTCLPKDINGLIKFSKTINVEPAFLKAVWNKNLQVRPEKDWENLVGRAITKE
tara:strand:- start:175 stop:1008 length:834 start_codon:yes stop_codon:yes gene_type:complete